jgi:hypothetical protein
LASKITSAAAGGVRQNDAKPIRIKPADFIRQPGAVAKQLPDARKVPMRAAVGGLDEDDGKLVPVPLAAGAFAVKNRVDISAAVQRLQAAKRRWRRRPGDRARWRIRDAGLGLMNMIQFN